MTQRQELKTRVLSAVMLVAAVLFITWYNPLSFDAMLMLAAFILLKEWLPLTRNRHWVFIPAGMLYVAAACFSLAYLRHVHPGILYAVFAIVWCGDVAAYLVGKRWGRHKIAPRISPGKSGEGLVASILVSAAVGATLGHVAPIPHALIGAALAVIGFGGDLFESSLKRRAGVKDSGTLIPGHGGLFDRVDALMPCAIFAALSVAIRTMH